MADQQPRRITKRAVLAEAATISSAPESSAAIVAAVRRASAGTIQGYAESARADGLESPGAVAHEVAVQIAMAEGVDW